ncbi:MAG: aldo/keto reductase [Candidatus Zixiibacteriota bacterium]
MPERNSDFSRRKFLSTAATGLVSAGVVSLSARTGLAQTTSASADSSAGGRIIERVLGRTGLRMPVVSMGVMNADNPEIVQASYELGIRHFDTAAYYQFGRNEQMVGSVIKKLGVRDKVIIGTKVMAQGQRQGLQPNELTQKLITACEASLGRLGTDRVEILYIHDVSDAETVKNPGLIEGLTRLKQQGKVGWVGVSTHTNMADVINAVVDGGFYDVVLTAINFTMADDTALLEAIKNASQKGVGIVAMKTQAGGARWPNPASRKDYSGSTIATAALKWVMRNEHIHTSIPGFTSFEHMREDFSVARNLEYTEQEKKFLSDNNVRMSLGYCRQCRKCLASCPGGVDIPTLMRVHMYGAQYGNFHHARTTLEEISDNVGLNVCSSCSLCSAECANTVDIARRIDELKTMYC